MESGKCRSCGAHINFIVTDKGRRCPVDAKPRHLVVDETGKDWAFLAVGEEWKNTKGTFSDVLDENAVEVYESHFRTCPNASQHSSKGKSKC